MLQTPVEALRSLSTFTQALDVLLPIVTAVAALAVLAAVACLLGLFLTELTQTRRREVAVAAPRHAPQLVPLQWWRGRSGKLAKLA